MPEKAPRNGIPERIPKNDIPEKAPRNDVPERAPRNGILERAPRNGISEGALKNGVLEGTLRNGVPEGASKNGVSERAPFVAVESVIFHQLPTSVTRNGRHLCERDPQLLSRIADLGHVSLGWPRPCGALTIYLCYELKS
jgi:hypothetical protein